MASLNLKRIVCDPSILGGKPVVRGTRISVEFILGLIHSGMSFDDILKEYSHLKRPDLEAVLAFARHAVSREEVVHFELAATR